MFDPTCIKVFRAYDLTGTPPNQTATTDTTALYAMIDASVLAEALAGLSPAQQTTINGYRYTPVASDFSSRGFPVWAGSDPAPNTTRLGRAS